MTQAELINQISTAMGKPTVLTLAKIFGDEQSSLHDLIDITFCPDKVTAFRAAWILENVLLTNPVKYQADLEYFVSRIKEVKQPGPQRHYAKILMHLTSPGLPQAIANRLGSIDLEPAVEQLFDWMIDPKAKIAVKVFASEALFNLRGRYNWITEELANQIQFLMRTGSPAIQARGKKLLAML